MSRKYKFHNPRGAYFVSFAVVEWLDVFTRNEYKNIFIDVLEYYQENHKLEVFAWCIMTNHVHLVFRSLEVLPQNMLGNIKRNSSKQILKAIKENTKESRKEILMNTFVKVAKKSSNVRNYQFWRHDNKPIEIWSKWVLYQKINYIHQNPVKAGFVAKPEDYLYSSARDYSGEKGYLSGVIVIN